MTQTSKERESREFEESYHGRKCTYAKPYRAFSLWLLGLAVIGLLFRSPYEEAKVTPFAAG